MPGWWYVYVSRELHPDLRGSILPGWSHKPSLTAAGMMPEMDHQAQGPSPPHACISIGSIFLP